jgi:cell division inhibitor SulA
VVGWSTLGPIEFNRRARIVIAADLGVAHGVVAYPTSAARYSRFTERKSALPTAPDRFSIGWLRAHGNSLPRVGIRQTLSQESALASLGRWNTSPGARLTRL